MTSKPKTEQIICNQCNSMKLQLLQISSNKKETTLDLLCQNCGLVHEFKIKGKTELEEQPTKPSPQTYAT